jgi:hypothetical protein
LEPSYPFTAPPEGAERDMAYSKAALNEEARRAGNRARAADGRAEAMRGGRKFFRDFKLIWVVHFR